MKIALCLIATRKYKQFVQPLLNDVAKYFLPDHEIEVHLFIDELGEYHGSDRVKVIQDLIPSYGFPEATLYRYRIMTSKTYNVDYIYYMDVDMSICAEVGDEILQDIMVVYHPGFFASGGGSWGDNKSSTSYTHPKYRRIYVAGGFQGGAYEMYYRLMKRLSKNIDEDERNGGVMAEWHDETHLNAAISEMRYYTALQPSYCMVEQHGLRKRWGIDHIPAIIVALAKNHNEIRS